MTDTPIHRLSGISGRTRVVRIIGHPTRQVRSTTTVNAAYASRGIDAVLVPIDLEEAAVPGFLGVLRGWLNAPGCVVTVPHKSTCADLVDGLTDRARKLGRQVQLGVVDPDRAIVDHHLLTWQPNESLYPVRRRLVAMWPPCWPGRRTATKHRSVAPPAGRPATATRRSASSGRPR